MSYKGLLLFFGVFLTWETRNVSFPSLNDSKYIGICVYNIFVISSVVLPVGMFAFPTNVDGAYILIATSVIFCTIVTLVLMFFAKVFLVVLVGSFPCAPPPVTKLCNAVKVLTEIVEKRHRIGEISHPWDIERLQLLTHVLFHKNVKVVWLKC